MNKKILNWWIGGASYTSEYQAILDRATALGYTHPSSAQKTKQNQLIVDLKAAGYWTLIDIFYSPANDGSEGFGQLNWKAPSSYQITKTGSPSWASNTGYTASGANTRLSTNFNPRSNGVNVTLNSASYGGKFVATRAANILFGGCTGLTATDDAILFQVAAGTNNFFRCHYDGVGSGTLTSGGTNFYCHLRRPDASNEYAAIDSTEATRAVSSFALPNAALLIFSNDTFENNNSVTCKCFWAGANSVAGTTMKTLLDSYISNL